MSRHSIPAATSAPGVSVGTRPQVGLGRSVRSEFVKMTTLKSTWLLLAINLLLLPLGGGLSAWALKIMATTNPKDGKPLPHPEPVAWADLWGAVGSMVDMCTIVVGVLGVMAVTAEFSTSSIDSTLAANPHRGMLLGAKAIVTAALAWASGQIGVLLALGLARIVASPMTLLSLDPAQGALPWIVLLGLPLLLAGFAVLAVGQGAFCRSTVAGVFVLVALEMLLPMLLGLFSSVSRFFSWMGTLSSLTPTQLMGNFLSGGSGPDPDSFVSGALHPSWWQSALILLVWVAAFYLAGTVVMRRRDVR
ncbi:hypothetical protein [Bifidobacterium xylocopae]|uniref:ABC transporter permease n=1 Tax=Bifidobacterium xylocopae TaxID=2493119 RepID=A0A366KAW4_9BIFI|nr:hypothetical protein [Bifidobacterium xylocopae]RBP98860.1 hypothetical protein CRD59_06940 [Bifidobacterium xylocopae]